MAVVGIAMADIATAQTETPPTPQLRLWASDGYAPITDMTNVRVAVIDARKSRVGGLLDLFRRYSDGARMVHSSVLERTVAPSHIFVTAQSVDGAKAIAKEIETYSRTDVHYQLLLAGQLQTNDTIPQIFEAVYHTPSATIEGIDMMVQAAFGGIAVTDSETAPCVASGLKPRQTTKTRLGYALPEAVGMNSETLEKIDDVMHHMISTKSSPGGYVLVARRGYVVWSKAYGHTQYHGGRSINPYSIYDLASVSKAIGTLPVVMQMYDNGDVKLDDTLGQYLPVPDDKRGISICRLLSHTSGLAAGVAAFMTCIDSTTLARPVYSAKRRTGFSVQIEPRLFIRDGIKLNPRIFADTLGGEFEHVVARDLFATDSAQIKLMRAIDEGKMLKTTYRYSDLNFIYLQRIAEQRTHRPLDELFRHNIAEPMGISRLLYCPLTEYDETTIVPTEDDRYFRHQLVRGTVHDQLAALLGGVAGNAGLFGTAGEVAKICQMYLNGGTYGGVRLFSQKTMDTFTTRHISGCRRGLGFDMPDPAVGKATQVSEHVSMQSYGHSGFSGTLFWIDPKEELVYIFLSNRICPDAYNTRLTRESIRTKVQDIIYESMAK